MSLLDRYGIKEVADVTFYELNDTKPGEPGAPVLYLDTLKVSTVEQTAENTDARGGKGNTALMTWDYGKEITLNIEDALFSMASLGVIYGNKASRAVKPLTKSKYLVVKNDVPFFINNGDGWIFNTDAANSMGLLWKGEENYYITEIKEVTGVVQFGQEDQECERIDGKVMTGIPSSVDSSKITIDARVTAQDHNNEPVETDIYSIELTEVDGQWRLDVDGLAWGQNCQGTLYATLTYPVLKTSEGTLQLREAGHTYDATVALVYDGHEFYLRNTPTSGFMTSKFEGMIEENEYGDQVIYLNGPQLFRIHSDRFTSCSVDISADTFPGTYYVTGDTYIRNEATGKDEFFQLILPKVKILSESNTITMEADGDPTVFNMSLKVLKSKEVPMMSLVQYEVDGLVPQEKIGAVVILAQTGDRPQAEGPGEEGIYLFTCEQELTDIPEGVADLQITVIDCELVDSTNSATEPKATIENGIIYVSGGTYMANELLRVRVRYKYNYLI